jgi:ubiquinone/menaquinone biosynthesis C-methylase UbiE
MLLSYEIPQIGLLELVCSSCHGTLLEEANNGVISCALCNKEFIKTTYGAIDFISRELSSSKKFGLANKLFEIKYGEHLYSYWITLKHQIQRLLKAEDKVIGLEEEIMGKVVLDVGCGPDLEAASTEYPHVTPRFYIGLDYSSRFVARAIQKHASPKHKFVRASASELPFRDNAFQITLALFTIHHVVDDPIHVLKELSRTTSEKVIIFDHVKSSNKLKAGLQILYWRLFDGGEHYLTLSEWSEHLRLAELEIVRVETSGIFFRHVIKFILVKK